jgi:hypothetical protein
MSQPTLKRSLTASTARRGKSFSFCFELGVVIDFVDYFVSYTYSYKLRWIDLCIEIRHVIVGRNFGSYVTHETKHFIYFYLGQVAVLLFKSG